MVIFQNGGHHGCLAENEQIRLRGDRGMCGGITCLELLYTVERPRYEPHHKASIKITSTQHALLMFVLKLL